jgi:hypothetical protein
VHARGPRRGLRFAIARFAVFYVWVVARSADRDRPMPRLRQWW